MTDTFLTVDGVLWACAVLLTGVATWLARPMPLGWEPAALFAAAWRELRRPLPLPLREGPVPPEGWTGAGADLGEDYDPARLIGPACGWDQLAAWGPDLQAALRRRLDAVSVVWFEPPGIELPGMVTHVLDDPAKVEERLNELCLAREGRFVIAARNVPGVVLRRLHDEPGLRDRVRAVLFVGADVGAERDWLAEHFTHVAFDLEMARELRFFTLRVEGGGAQVLRDPPPAPREVVRVHDLGLVDPTHLTEPSMGRALVLVLAALE